LSGFNNISIEPVERINGELTYLMPDTIDLNGLLAIRVNGLVQFIRNVSGKQSYILDVETTISPDSKDYIFNISRENVNDKRFNEWILEFSNNLVTEPITANDDFNDEIVAETIEFDGGLRYGLRDNGEINDTIVSEWADYKTRAQGFARYQRNRLVEQAPDGVEKHMLDRSYVEEFGDRVAENWHWKLLEVWREILAILVVETDERFYVGLITDSGAAREHDAGYLINPSAISQCESKAGVVTLLYQMAVHEYAHRYYGSHDQQHSYKMLNIFKETAELFVTHMSYLKRRVVKSIMQNTNCPNI